MQTSRCRVFKLCYLLSERFDAWDFRHGSELVKGGRKHMEVARICDTKIKVYPREK